MPEPKEPTAQVPKPLHAEGARQSRQGKEPYVLKREKGTALHEDESEFEAFHRIHKLVYNVGLTARQKYDAKIAEIRDAYQGIVNEAITNPNSPVAKRVFPLVFSFVDVKLSSVLASKPRAVFENPTERQKLPIIEDAYKTFTEDVNGNGLSLDDVDYQWHWYCELYGWSVKRVWFEVDTTVCYKTVVKRDENGHVTYDEDGLPAIEYKRKLYRSKRVKHYVCEPDEVIVDPSAKCLAEARWIAFMRTLSYDEYEQQYRFNPVYQNTDYVDPGKLGEFPAMDAPALVEGTDVNGNKALMYGSSLALQPDSVRILEFYHLDRDEFYMSVNNIPHLHIPNPCPADPETGKKLLPAADLHDRLRPGSFYSMGEGELTEPIVSIYQKLMNAKATRAQLAASPVILSSSDSAVSPKSFKVVPGAHFRGMLGKLDTLNLAGGDTGEVDKYLADLRNMAKVAQGVDFERFIADPDPTYLQQAARDAAAQTRTTKDIRRYESAHVRSMDLTVRNIQFWLTIPEIADLADASEEELAQIKEYDKLPADEATGTQMYRKYLKIITKGRRYVEEYDEKADRFNLVPDRKAGKGVDGYIYARPEYMQTKTRVRVRAVSDRKQSQNQAVRTQQATELVNLAFSLPPKNDAEIQQAMATGKPAPPPKYFISRSKAIERRIEAMGEDVKELTMDETDSRMERSPALQAISGLLKAQHTVLPTQEDDEKLRQLALSSPRIKPSPTPANVSAPQASVLPGMEFAA